MLYADAAPDAALQGVDLQLRPTARVVPRQGVDRAIDAALEVRAGEAALSDPAVSGAVHADADWATKTWARAVASTVGPWLLGNGVTELHWASTIRPDRSRRLDVLAGCPIDDGPLH